jgi:glycosyltransferase involved in cell wall biosynthesis
VRLDGATLIVDEIPGRIVGDDDEPPGRLLLLDRAGNATVDIQTLKMPYDAAITPDGNFLVTIIRERAVWTVTPAGETLARMPVGGYPCSLQLLDDGNVLVAGWDDDVPGFVREFDLTGQVVWSAEPLRWPWKAERLQSGNTLIADAGTKRMFEVTPGGDEVWAVEGLGPETPELFDAPIRAKAKVLHVHDVHCGPALTEAKAHGLTVLGLSEWHVGFLRQVYPFLTPEQVRVMRNGIDSGRFSEPAPARNPSRAVYSSSPDRGLLTALECWPRIRRKVPDAELHIFYGFDNWEKTIELSGDTAQLTSIKQLRDLIEQTEGVFAHGRVDQARLAREFMGSGVWANATWFSETSCLTSMEAQAAGLFTVTSPIAALPETCSPKGTAMIEGGWRSEDYRRAFAKAVIEAMTCGDEFMGATRAQIQEQAKRHDLDARGDEWDAMLRDLVYGKAEVRPRLWPEGTGQQGSILEAYKNKLYGPNPDCDLNRWCIPAYPLLVGGSVLDAQDWAHLEKDFGITFCINVEMEHSDVGKMPPDKLCEALIHDDGRPIDAANLEKAVDAAKAALERASGRLYVHCQMGGSRSPAFAYAILRACFSLDAASAIAPSLGLRNFGSIGRLFSISCM